MNDPKIEDEAYSEAETVARREAALKRLLATPHKPHVKNAKSKGRVNGKSRKAPD